jgi:transketolase C-terminal domain/subunit
VRNDAAYHEANVKIVAIGGGFSYGALGMSHHATEDLAILRAIPGITVVAPGCVWEVEEATDAIAATPGVCTCVSTSRRRSPTGRGRRLRWGRSEHFAKGLT